MKVGLDFDGVVSDCGRLKSDGARRIYNIEIPPDKFKRELVVNTGILTSEQYTEFQRQIYEDPEIGLKMLHPVYGALEYIAKLQQSRHDLIVVSSRGVGNKLQIAREWIMLNGLNLDIRGVDLKNSKAEACKGLDVYVDDDLDKLEPLVDIVPHRYLFSWGYNAHIKIPQSVAKRVSSWNNLYKEIIRLNKC